MRVTIIFALETILYSCFLQPDFDVNRKKYLFEMKKVWLLSVVCCLLSVYSFSQSQPVYHIGLILPLQAEGTMDKLDAYLNARDFYTASRITLNEDAHVSLDFYQGILQALKESNDSFKIEMSVYDNQGSDSVTKEILKREEVKKLNIIIGSMSSSSAKLVADFCKQNKIINLQPFTPSKSLTSSNPYHLKLAPTIDAHVEAMFNSIVDSFSGSNVIIYTPDVEKSFSVAREFDTLFTRYNRTTDTKFKVTMLKTKAIMLNGKEGISKEQLKAGKTNILIITSFDESFINGALRVLFDVRDKFNVVVYGMPTWLKGDILRLDYVNEFATHLTDQYFIDSTKDATQHFIQNYKADFEVEPARYAFLGYDLMNFALQSLKNYGLEFMDFIPTERYSGTAYKFDIVKSMKNPATINYLENRHVHVFKVQDYQLKEVW